MTTRLVHSSTSPSSRPGNRLLARLPLDVLSRIEPHLTIVPTTMRQVFHKRGDPIREVYFLNGGVGSITAGMEDGTMVEVATVGDEGVLGIGAFYGTRLSNVETMLQVPDTNAARMSVDAFRTELALQGAFYEAVTRYSEGLLALIMQSTACMALHQVHERGARWLLMAHDRVRRDHFELSHEFLSMMLGASRPTVSVAAGALQEAGLITYKYGHITILNRTGLEEAACECYAQVARQYEELGL
jgi:CRP-like cAMP-binding protein